MKQNEPLSSLTHFIGLLLSIAALVLMIVFAALYGSAWHIVGVSIFGASMILLYCASTVYHAYCKTHHAKSFLQKMDRSFIYVLIAGTYTPLTLVVLHGAWGWTLFGMSWGLAVLGILAELLIKKRKSWISIPLYLIMGWLIVIAINPLLENLSHTGFLFLLLGGICYTIGVLFFILDIFFPGKRWLSFHDIFHLFVIAGSFLHFWVMIRYVIYIPVV
ncbi:hemolysin III family protein [Candidatus Woesearchaeota archaeon]|nr:hemolysin III family protein [Candidatus Woesearchaeota archaeon]